MNVLYEVQVMCVSRDLIVFERGSESVAHQGILEGEVIYFAYIPILRQVISCNYMVLSTSMGG